VKAGGSSSTWATAGSSSSRSGPSRARASLTCATGWRHEREYGSLADASTCRSPWTASSPAATRDLGGARIANSLIRERLVDEYRLTLHPVALGDWLPLMQGLPELQRFEMVSSAAYADGSIAQVLGPR
jgi:hypothetical protein